MQRSILKTPEEVSNWFLDCPKVLAIDFETTGLNYLTMELVGISFCDRQRSCYIDLWENEDAGTITEFLRNILVHCSLGSHNAKFEYKCCKKFLGRDDFTWFCTYIASFLLDENRSSHSLDSLALDILGVGKSGKWEDYTDYHSEEFYEYAIRDSELCFDLYCHFSPLIQREELDYIFKIEMDFLKVAAEIEMNGVLVDQKELKALQLRTENKLIELEDRMYSSVGMRAETQQLIFGGVERLHPINLRSSQQLIKVIEKKCDLQVLEKTEKGAKSVTSETIKRLKGQHPFIDYLSDYKKFRKLYDGYIIPAWEQIDEDGRIRPDIGIVKTGRTSNRNPNLQQLPNVSKRFPEFNYRSIFIAPRGNKLVGGDYSGQELRLLGEISQDERILNAFSSNHDLHLLTANHIFDLGLGESSLVSGSSKHGLACDQYKSERYRAKNGANFPIVYGSTAKGISWRQGVSVSEAQKWVDGFHKAYPRVQIAMDETAKELRENGYVTTLFGRKRRFPDYKTASSYHKSRMIRQAFNFKIQGLAADQCKIAAIKLHKQGIKILMLIHDEVVVSCKEEDVDKTKMIMEDCMVNAISLSVPFKIEIKSGDSYAEIK